MFCSAMVKPLGKTVMLPYILTIYFSSLFTRYNNNKTICLFTTKQSIETFRVLSKDGIVRPMLTKNTKLILFRD